MKRKAILIAAPGSEVKGNYLSGVNKDIDKYQSFLVSRTGGAWDLTEIDILANPTLAALKSALAKLALADYAFTVFSGHGGISTIDGKGYIEINDNDEDFPVEDFYNKCPKHTVILDTCRTYFTPNKQIFNEMRKAENAIGSSRALYRAKFDEAVQKADNGTIILSAASPGEAANEDINGGLFSQGLLANSNPPLKTTIYINQAFFSAKSFVEGRRNDQHPTMEGAVRRSSWYPFSLKP
jgi:hypothetical protein